MLIIFPFLSLSGYFSSTNVPTFVSTSLRRGERDFFTQLLLLGKELLSQGFAAGICCVVLTSFLVIGMFAIRTGVGVALRSVIIGGAGICRVIKRAGGVKVTVVKLGKVTFSGGACGGDFKIDL